MNHSFYKNKTTCLTEYAVIQVSKYMCFPWYLLNAYITENLAFSKGFEIEWKFKHSRWLYSAWFKVRCEYSQ